MSDKSVISAIKKEATGTGPSREIRRTGRVPAIIYGGGKSEAQVALDQKELVKTYSKGGFFSRIITIELDGQKIDVLPREIQLHPLTELPVHADFQRIDPKANINVKVRVKTINSDKSPGLKRGGVLNIVRHVVELSCPPAKIPSEIQVDLSGLQIGASVHISAVKLPEGVKPVITDRDFTIATIAGRASEEEKAAVATDAAAAPAVGSAAAPAAAGKAAAPAAKPADKKK